MLRSYRATALAALLLAPVLAQARTTVLLPMPGSVVTGEVGVILGFCDDPGRSEISIQVNGETYSVELWDGVFELDADWREGHNLVAVGGQRVSFTSDRYAEQPREPLVHQALLDNCANCHRLGADLDLALRDDRDRLCANCHADRVAPDAHRGTECSACHAPHTSWEPRLLRLGEAELCATCHEAASWSSTNTAHSAIGKTLDCSRCHAAHDPGLRDREACVGCHGEHRSGVSSHMDVDCARCHWMHRDDGHTGYKEPVLSCGGCHELPAEAEHGDVVAECAGCHQFHAGPVEESWGAATCGPCHPEVDAHPDYHGAQALTECAECHPVHDPRNLSAALAGCSACHGEEALQATHPQPTPLAGDCRDCHRLHGSPADHALMPGQTGAFRDRACWQCHGQPAFAGGTTLTGTWGDLCLGCHRELATHLTHQPVAAGRCDSCHLAHGGEWSAALRTEPDRLCATCHADTHAERRAATAAGRELIACVDCHDPHGDPGGAQSAGDRDHCTRCHTDPALAANADPGVYLHGPLNTGQCSTCHPPHRHGEKPDVGSLCRGCHVEQANAVQVNHAPAAAGNCTACHDPHAGDNPLLLRNDRNELCLACHGTRNHQHSLQLGAPSAHVSVPEDCVDEGARLACRGCHRSHGSDQEPLLVLERDELCGKCHAG